VEKGNPSMRKKIVILLCLLIVAMLISCGTPHRTKSSQDSPGKTYTIAVANYDISLISVDRPAQAKQLYGEQKIETVIQEGILKSYFEDGMVGIEWRPTPDDIGLVIRNKTYDPLIVIWDEARLFDEKGNKHGLTHAGIGYEERNDSHPPTVIAARGTLEDFMHPADSFQREETHGRRSYTQNDQWERSPFLPTQIKGTADELRAKVEPLTGKTFQVLLPLQTNDVRTDYVYTFKINRVDVKEKEQKIDKKSNDGKEGSGTGRSGRRRLL
jgi:hypothetical protein